MITLNGTTRLQPTIFPDGTSQVWHIPDYIKAEESLHLKWTFESEREIIDLLALRKIVPREQRWYLTIPFLPYARQDKEISNDDAFNLAVIADLLNSLRCKRIEAVDVHNPERAAQLINNFTNVPPGPWHTIILKKSNPDYLVFPDLGAKHRYLKRINTERPNLPIIVGYKERDPTSGKLLRHTISLQTKHGPRIQFADMNKHARSGDKFLIIDDICDGGATFISLAKLLHEQVPNAVVDLCVTHGIFSRGREHLHNNGINTIYTKHTALSGQKEIKV